MTFIAPHTNLTQSPMAASSRRDPMFYLCTALPIADNSIARLTGFISVTSLASIPLPWTFASCGYPDM